MTDSPQHKSRRRGWLGYIRLILAVIPAIILAVIVYLAVHDFIYWTSYGIEAGARAGAYAETATAIAPTSGENNDVSSGMGDFAQGNNTLQLARLQQNSPTPAEPSRTPFPTNTPHPTDLPPTAAPATNTPGATPTTPPLPTVFFPAEGPADASAPTAIPTQFPLADRRGNDLLNVALIGSDSAVDPNDPGFRTDSLIIVSVNRTEGTVNMLSLPRDLYVYIPGWTMQRLNLAYQRGETVGWTGGGFGLLRQTILYNFGINVHYYASIDFDGFEQIVDQLGGSILPLTARSRTTSSRAMMSSMSRFTSSKRWTLACITSTVKWRSGMPVPAPTATTSTGAAASSKFCAPSGGLPTNKG